MAAAAVAPPRLRWPAPLTAALIVLFPEAFPMYLMRRFGAGRAVSLRMLGMGEAVVFSDPAAIKEVFAADRDALRAGEAAEIVIGPVAGDGSLLRLDGDEHLRVRRLLSPAFHGEAVHRYRTLVEEIAAAQIARFPSGRPFALQPHMHAITLEVILRAVAGVTDERRLARLRVALPRMLEVNPMAIVAEATYPWIGRGVPARALPWIRARREVDALLYAEIAAHRAAPEGRDDVLAMLIAEGSLTDRELRDQLVTLLLAGHETTAGSLAWCFERLLHTPGEMQRLQRAVDEGDDAWLSAVVDETLRTRPVLEAAWRRVRAPVEIGGFRIEPDTMVAVAIRGVHRRADLYPDPQAFRPARFAGTPGPAHALVPFGGGPRRCLGASMAVMEMKTVVRAVLERVELRPATRRAERQSRIRRYTTIPARGARAIAVPRSSSHARPSP